MNAVIQEIASASLVFWDFDGVIKDSIGVKASAFEELFLPFGADVAARVRAHHEENAGVSRFQKMPLYLGWANVSATPTMIDAYCSRFSNLVVGRVIDSPWVPGVREYLIAHHACQRFVLLTATPQLEIEHIVNRLGIDVFFQQVFGAPTVKSDAIKRVLATTGDEPHRAVMVGDAETDLAAATANGIGFLLRRTELNRGMQSRKGMAMFDDLAS